MTQSRTIIKIQIIPWEESKGEWGILIRYKDGSVAEKIGTHAQAELERVRMSRCSNENVRLIMHRSESRQ